MKEADDTFGKTSKIWGTGFTGLLKKYRKQPGRKAFVQTGEQLGYKKV